MTVLDETRYAELLREKQPRIIRTEKENERALRAVEELMSRGEHLRAEETELLELLTILIERFEQEHYAWGAATPQDILRELMAARAMSQTELSRLFPSKGIASEVLAGKRDISKAQARKLGDFFHVPAAIFLEI
jgi:HTH-type transcriptional regulator/antitoxin HigA